MFYSKTVRNIFVGIVLLFLVSLGVLVVMYNKISFLSSPEKIAEKEIDSVVRDVRKIMDLPQDETPVLAVINNDEQLKNQPLFQNAEVGNKILIYEENRKIVIYNHTTNKIVEVIHISSTTEFFNE